MLSQSSPRRRSFFSFRRRKNAEAKPPPSTPYIPQYAARSFVSTTTPLTLEERRTHREKAHSTSQEAAMTLSEKSEAMRELGKARGQINIDLQL